MLYHIKCGVNKKFPSRVSRQCFSHMAKTKDVYKDNPSKFWSKPDNQNVLSKNPKKKCVLCLETSKEN